MKRRVLAREPVCGPAPEVFGILDVLRPETRRAYKEIAAAIVDGYREGRPRFTAGPGPGQFLSAEAKS